MHETKYLIWSQSQELLLFRAAADPQCSEAHAHPSSRWGNKPVEPANGKQTLRALIGHFPVCRTAGLGAIEDCSRQIPEDNIN